MSEILPYYQGLKIRDLSELPPHINFQEYLRIIEAVGKVFESIPSTDDRIFRQRRDILFLTYLWETGGRVGDVCDILVSDIDMYTHNLNLRVRKRKKTIIVTLNDRLLFETSEYLRNFKIEGKLFDFTRQYAWQQLKKYAEVAGVKGVHPHKFRHGLAIYLLEQKVPIPVISTRLGHSNVLITMQLYMKITPEIQRMFMENVKMRGNGQ